MRGNMPFAEYMNQIKAWAAAYDREPAPMRPEEFGAILDEIYAGSYLTCKVKTRRAKCQKRKTPKTCRATVNRPKGNERSRRMS